MHKQLGRYIFYRCEGYFFSFKSQNGAGKLTFTRVARESDVKHARLETCNTANYEKLSKKKGTVLSRGKIAEIINMKERKGF